MPKTSEVGDAVVDRAPVQLRRADARALIVVYVVLFIGFLGYSLMITVFTPMILEGRSAIVAAGTPGSRRTIMLGLLLCLYPLGQFVGSPIIGALSDRFGRKPVLMISLIATTACYAIIAAALDYVSFATLCAASFVAGLSEANIVTAQSAISDVIPPDDRNRYFGYIYMSVSAAYIVGPLAGGKLADRSLASWCGYSTPFWVVFVLLVITIMATLVAFTETKPPEARQQVSYFEAFTNLEWVFKDRRLRHLYAVNFLLYLAIFGFFRCYPMYLVDEYKLGVSKVSEFIAWVGVPIVMANLGLTGALSRHFSARGMTIWSGILTGAMMIIVIVPHAQSAAWVTLFLAALALAICLPSCATMLSVSATESEQGRVMGNNQALQVGAEALSGLIGGLLASVVVKLSLVVLGGVAIAGGLLLLASHAARNEAANV
ncbi:MAG TPA: MFS transporter [Candidatus Binataceae bacterium]|nr:MFS transporter [Candidatus Binataceae bacterium]